MCPVEAAGFLAERRRFGGGERACLDKPFVLWLQAVSRPQQYLPALRPDAGSSAPQGDADLGERSRPPFVLLISFSRGLFPVCSRQGPGGPRLIFQPRTRLSESPVKQAFGSWQPCLQGRLLQSDARTPFRAPLCPGWGTGEMWGQVR